MKRKALTLDAIDRRIIAVLRGEGRITNQALSERVGLSARPCLERVRKLEASGLIRGYGARLAPELAGHAIVAFAQISLRDHSVGRRERVEKVLKSCPDVVEVQVVSGEADYLARIVAGSLADYEELTGAWLADAQLGVARIATTFALKALKEFEGYPLGEE
ncbi:Lrp/AsnC family leucine-responsive transcriptional regulator [Bosea sp. BE125]|uniref:Lrp/AsnC family transcriptional regulator n=1 Tax=Bosea sp. BE125 TaxID=2817909 RepID=UPI00286208FE|nr:Lrp/AsnC family transcriptional regulator [Bosea sp. BE125]MDR6873116.1 Lrp/AsnC family leucine-responsive transcriptional regulator [Bosea sp. BE125]